MPEDRSKIYDQYHLKEIGDIQLDIKKTRPGSRYAYDLYDEYHNIILEAHQPISESLIKHLIDNKTDYLYYDPTKKNKKDLPEEKSENIAGLDLNVDVVSKAMQNQVKENIKDLLDSIRNIYEFSTQDTLSAKQIEKSKDMVNELLDDISKNKNGIFTPIDIVKTLDDYDYNHSTNVSILAAYLSSSLEYKKDDRVIMGLCGLFHDIGKSGIPKEILGKNDRLSDEECNVIKKHPALGYKLVEKNRDFGDLEKKTILLHHENPDGRGYPYGFDHSKYETSVPKEVRLIAICDIFVALTTQRPGREKFTSSGALKTLLNMVYAPYKTIYKFLPDDFRDFARSVGYTLNRGDYFIKTGDLIRLNNGEVAVIEEMNKLSPLKPKVTILTDQEKNKVKKPFFVDLQLDFTRYISNILERNIKE